jgi:hypothetical protein
MFLGPRAIYTCSMRQIPSQMAASISSWVFRVASSVPPFSVGGPHGRWPARGDQTGVISPRMILGYDIKMVRMTASEWSTGARWDRIQALLYIRDAFPHSLKLLFRVRQTSSVRSRTTLVLACTEMPPLVPPLLPRDRACRGQKVSQADTRPQVWPLDWPSVA